MMGVRFIIAAPRVSTSAGGVTGFGLTHFEELLTEVQNQRRRIDAELQAAKRRANTLAERERAWATGSVMRHLFEKKYTRIQEELRAGNKLIAELTMQLRQARLPVQIEMPAHVHDAFTVLCDAFMSLAKCQRKWDVSAGVSEATRVPVHFALASSDLIESQWRVPHLQTAKGQSLYIYPGFVLIRMTPDGFKLLDLDAVEVFATRIELAEAESLPADASVVDRLARLQHEMLNGQRDRVGQLPVVEYGKLELKCRSTLHTDYMVSYVEAAIGFADVWEMLQREICKAVGKRVGDAQLDRG